MRFNWKASNIFFEISEYLEARYFDNKEYIVIISEKETKEIRTLAQNKSFRKLFTDIWNHLWETKEDVKEMLLGWVFGTKEVKIWKIIRDVNIEKHTSELTKEQWIHFIECILAFVKKYDMPITITSNELKSLFDSYKYENN